MATKKDLVEAHAFSRRRLVTAFVSGAPGGREVEPSRPGRTIVGGVALAVLVVAGGAVAGVFKPRVESDWTEPGLVTSKEKATDYLLLEPAEGEEPVRRPLINITSAQLLFGADVEATSVPEAELTTVALGAPIGILGAPGSPPEAADLVNTGWVACTGDGLGTAVTVTEDDVVEASPGTGLLVVDERDYYVIGEGAGDETAEPRAHRYPVDLSAGGLSDTTLRALTGSISSQAVEVPDEWLRLFPAGGPLEVQTLGLGRVGARVDYARSAGLPRSARVGDYYELDGTTYVLGVRAPSPLTAFEEVLVRAEAGPDAEVSVEGDPGSLRLPDDQARWPAEPLTAPTGPPCARLTPDETTPGVSLVRPTGDGEAVSAGDVPAGEVAHVIDSEAGAFVHSAAWDNEPGAGEPFLVDSRGERFLLQGPDVPALLGYGDVPVLTAPSAWLELFAQGVTLSVDAARCPPARGDREPCE